MKTRRHISRVFVLSVTVMLTLVTLLIILPISASAAEVAGGNCGDSLTWSLTDDGTLTVSGTGAMTSSPWSAHKASIKRVVLPDGLTTIGKSAFSQCTALGEIVIPDSVTNIGGMAFYRCTGLAKAVIGDGVTRIEDSAFRSCSKLAEVTIGRSVSFIQGSTSNYSPAFTGCSSLKKVINKSMLPIIKGTKTQGEVARYAEVVEFDWSSTCGESLTWTLNSNDCILRITGTGAMTSHPWSDMAALIRGVEIENGATTICGGAFAGFVNLREIVIPDSVTVIGGWAFEKCTALEKADIGDGVERIEEAAFIGCTSLGEVTVGDSVTFIQNGTSSRHSAFSGCTGLKKVINKSMLPVIKGQSENGEVAKYADAVEFHWSSTCGESLTWTLDNSDFILRIAGSGTMTSRPWSGMRTLIRGVEFAGDCEIESICNNAFEGFTQLTGIDIPDTVASIGNDAFSGCIKLEEIVIPDSVTSLGSWAFYNCKELKRAVIGDGVTRIEDSAFRSCAKLAEVTIGESVTFIQHNTAYCYPAFSGCSSLKKVINKSSLSLIKGQENNGEVAMNADTVEFNWHSTCGENLAWTLSDTDYILRIAGTGEMTSNPWSGMKALIRGVEFTDGSAVTSFCKNAFEGMTQLTSFTIPDTVVNIGSGAFSGCTALREIVIPDSVTGLGGSAFYGCTGLERAVIGDKVTRIEDSAFMNCTSLAEVTIGGSVTFIQHSTAYCYPAFSGCSNLRKVINRSMLPIIKGEKAHGEVAMFADTVEFHWSSTCGENLTWTLDSDDLILRIAGGGEMTSHPWSGMAAVIRGVEIENGATTICGGAFAGFVNLREIVIPDSVTVIGGWAFEKCTALEKAVIGDGVTSIGDGAFFGCTALAEVTVGASVTFIQHSTAYCYPAFNGCSGLVTVINRSALMLTAGGNDHGEVAKFATVIYNTIIRKTAVVSDTVYNGQEQKQAVTVDGLTEGTDFEVTYSGDYTNVGVVTVTVTGKGTYFGTITATYTIAKAQRSAPAAPVAQVVGTDSLTLTEIDGCEYSIDGENWQDSPVFGGLTVATKYTFRQRYKETDNYHVSDVASAEISTHTHEWADGWSKDGTHHWHQCNGCEEREGYAVHTFDQTTVHTAETLVRAGTCTGNAVYKYTCVCGAVGTQTYEKADSKDAGNHTGTGFTFTANGDGTHTKKHECCGAAAETVNCSGGTATCLEKAKCVICGAEYGEKDPSSHVKDTFTYTPNADGETHTKKHECCGAVSAEAEAHAYGEDGKCICGADKPHVHAPGAEWKYNDTAHWHECACGEKADEAAHSFGEWTVTKEATEAEAGEKTRTCVCGKVETETIPAVEPGTDPTTDPGTETGNEPGTETEGNEQTDDGLPAGAVVAIVVGGVVVVGAGGFAVYWFVIKKKKFSDLVTVFHK